MITVSTYISCITHTLQTNYIKYLNNYKKT